MSKNYKKKHVQEEVVVETNDTLSKKELYDLEKQKRLALKEKEQKKKDKKKKSNKKPSQTNLGTKLFAIIMLVLMLGSVLASALAYVVR